MKLTWLLLLSVCLAVAYSQIQEEFDIEDDSVIEEFNNFIEELTSNLEDDDFGGSEFENEFEEEIDDSEDAREERSRFNESNLQG